MKKLLKALTAVFLNCSLVFYMKEYFLCQYPILIHDKIALGEES